MSFLGIDVGNRGTRALVIDEAGRVIASPTEERRELTAEIGAARLIEFTSNHALTNFTFTQCSWVRENRRCSKDLRQAVQTEESFLPDLYESPEICGRMSAAGSAATGLQIGTPVVGEAGDQAAGAIGMDIVSPCKVSATVGTLGVVFAATARPALDLRERLYTENAL